MFIIVRKVDSCTMNGIIDGKPARDDRGSLTAQQRVNVNVNFPYGIVRTVRIMVQDSDLQRFILQVFIINLGRRRRIRKQVGAEMVCYVYVSLIISEFKAINPHQLMN